MAAFPNPPTMSPSSKMSVSLEKIHKELTTCLIGTPMISGHGKVAGTCTGAVPTQSGLLVYVAFDEKTLPDIPDKGFSFEIPLWKFLPEGEMPMCPSIAGLYEINLSNGAVLQASYDPVGGRWFGGTGTTQIGVMHEVRLPDWRHPAIVVGLRLIAEYQSSMKVVVVSERVLVPEVVAEPVQLP